ncbi:WhiB transcriptional regulator [Corynebacterium maris DSM 45190]|uniref:Transcriptional regulator WhiB n=1 Tax=Corynebacterium maris DSM 45190 TaxID=1224163 RepID=S5SRN4_9CORY|nr:WhiB family transcriptional regulator [Corynebacterium maris]AGS33784.1 WhiB transcriptional regulator [Corynebacterium maris DSM 45190]
MAVQVDGSKTRPLSFERDEWVARSVCRNGDPDALFVRGAQQREAATVCRGCPVAVECLSDALDNRIEFGVWGGLTERQRRALLKRNPDIEDWAGYLAHGGKIDGV